MLFPKSLKLTAACAPDAPPPMMTTSRVMTSDMPDPVVTFELCDIQALLPDVHDAVVVLLASSKATGQENADRDMTIRSG